MPSRMRRPPPDRQGIISSMGLPPREPVPEPTSPTYYPTFPRSRRDDNASGGRYSERSYDGRRAAAAATGDRTDMYDDPRRKRSTRRAEPESRQDSRRSMQDDGRRRFESLPASSRPRASMDSRRMAADLDDLPFLPSTMSATISMNWKKKKLTRRNDAPTVDAASTFSSRRAHASSYAL